MGEENAFAGIGQKLFFCIKEDVGTEREQWREIKLDNIQVRKSIEASELNTEKMKGEETEWSTSFTLSAEIEDSGQIRKLVLGMKKHQSGLRHYAHKTMTKSAKKALRQCHLHMKKCMFGRSKL